MALALIVIAVWTAAGFGSLVVGRLAALRDHPLERFVYACAIGLGTASYGVFLLGLLGLLRPVPVLIWWAVLGLCGLRGMSGQAQDLARWVRGLRKGIAVGADQHPDRWERLLKAFCLMALIAVAAVAVPGCFRPPGAIEWDALAYHLADPKVYLSQHRISILPTEHHSNFPFTMEMLFTVGLMFNGYPLANLFHFVTALLTVLALIAFAHRLVASTVGYVAAVIYATTPLVIWEACSAYIDVAGALYSTLALLAAISAIEAMRLTASTERSSSPSNPQAELRNWLALAGITMGFALGIKYLALIPFALCAVLLAARKIPVRAVAIYLGIAIVIGSPWYLKNVIWMSNPVYPFYYRVFPHTRYWSEDREIAYRSEQDRFGSSHSLSRPREALLNLLETPWRLVVSPSSYYNQGEFTYCALIGGLYCALALPLLLLRRLPRVIVDIGWLTAAQMLIWFFLAQIGRYLLQYLPLAALLVGYMAYRLFHWHRSGTVYRIAGRGAVIALVAGQTILVLTSLFFLPTGGVEAAELEARTGLLPTAFSIPETISILIDSSKGRERLQNRLDIYNAEEWINQNTRAGEGVILYEETRGYYLDRPYLWGNDAHSSFIPYAALHSGSELTDWFRQRDYTHAIINLNWSSLNKEGGHIDADQAASLVQSWYIDRSYRPGQWEYLVSDALKQGLWRIVDVEHGSVILQIGGS